MKCCSSTAPQQYYRIKAGDLRHKARVRAVLLGSSGESDTAAASSASSPTLVDTFLGAVSADARRSGISLGDVRTAISSLFLLLTSQRGISVSLANHGRSLRRPDIALGNTASMGEADGASTADCRGEEQSLAGDGGGGPALVFGRLSVDVAQEYWVLAEEDAMKDSAAYARMRRVDKAALRSEGGDAFAKSMFS